MRVAITARKSGREPSVDQDGSGVIVTDAGFVRTTGRITEGNVFASTIRVP
jgi:hypothetical protein